MKKIQLYHFAQYSGKAIGHLGKAYTVGAHYPAPLGFGDSAANKYCCAMLAIFESH